MSSISRRQTSSSILALTVLTGVMLASPAVADDPDGMVHVPGGVFTMGSTSAEWDAALAMCEAERGEGKCQLSWFDIEDRREVDVAAFYIDKFEVTVDAYSACVDAGSCAKPECDSSGMNWDAPGRGDHPVNCVTWQQAVDYCAWSDKRLPTEEEWEKAARGTDGRVYPWGNAHPTDAGRVGNFADATLKKAHSFYSVVAGYDDGYEGTSPVGTYAAGASPCGAHDMAGNVREWTSTEYSASERVVRGGTWRVVSAFVRASYRFAFFPTFADGSLGFRCARSAP